MRMNPRAFCLACLATMPEARFAVRLKAFRLSKGWTQAELAKRAGLRLRAIHLYESGARRPRWQELGKLVRVLSARLIVPD